MKRGDICYADLGQPIGSEQGGIRPVIILQNDTGNRYSPTTIIAPLTKLSHKKSDIPTHRVTEAEGLKEPSIMLFEQIRCIDKQRIREYVGHYNENFDEQIKISLGL